MSVTKFIVSAFVPDGNKKNITKNNANMYALIGLIETYFFLFKHLLHANTAPPDTKSIELIGSGTAAGSGSSVML
jgi:hypothetical protein